MLHWRHTGFNVHSKVRTESKEDTERVGKYMIRPILSLKRLSLHEGQVLYQYGNHSSERESMDCPCGGRGKMRKKESDPLCPLVFEDEDPFIPSKGWAEMIKKVYFPDVLSFLWVSC
ncbi:MAG: transposase [Candidatus Aminicenantes bacterium]|nr:transposase [Candidatus Aminicenantes bacterium]